MGSVKEHIMGMDHKRTRTMLLLLLLLVSARMQTRHSHSDIALSTLPSHCGSNRAMIVN